MSARDAILGRLAGAGFSTPLPAPDLAAYYGQYRRDESPSGKLARFTAAIVSAHAEVHDTDDAHWPDMLARIATAKGLGTLLIGDDSPDARRLTVHPPAGLRLRPYRHPIDGWRSEMFNAVDAGLTRARSAIAATGSLVVWPDAREPRLMSLVPPVHFVLLDAAAVHADLQEAMQAENWSGTLPTNALLISGPSKTADIQQTLAYGAHGPRELVVLILHPAGGRP